MKKLKILLSGAHGTGKSTVNNDLMSHLELKGFTQIDSVSKIFASSLDTFKDPGKLMDFQCMVSFYCFARYIHEDNIVSSRSFADTYAYSMYEYKKSGNVLFKQLADLSLELIKRYSTPEYKHIYIPIMFDLESKDLRSANVQFQKEIDLLFKEFYQLAKEAGVEYLELKSLDRDDRVQEILEYCSLE